jgi:hypothetical protein
VTFVFCGTGRRFVKDGKLYRIENQRLQSEQAFKSGLSFAGKPMRFALRDAWGVKPWLETRLRGRLDALLGRFEPN